MTITALMLAQHLGGEVRGDGAQVLTGFAAADLARSGDLTFAEKEAFFEAAEKSAASAILVSGPFESASKVIIRVPNARVAAAKALALFYPAEVVAPGVDPSATVSSLASVAASAYIGPGCVVGDHVRIGERTVLTGGNHIGAHSRIGDDCRLYPNVVIYHQIQIGNRVAIHAGTVIGADGYGYVFDQGKHLKIPQIGNVVIQDDVEIGANTCIDRAALGSTLIGKGTKIDNLVHIAHNVEVGNHCLIMGQVGFAGSTRLGDYGVIASQTGIAGHLTLGRQVTVGGKSGVMRDIPDKETVLGFPAVPDGQAKRQWVGIQRLPDLIVRMRELEKKVAELTARP